MRPDLNGLRVTFVAGTLGPGGAERQLFYILQALVAQGACPRVLSVARGEFWEQPIRNLGVPVDWIGRRPSRLSRLIAAVRAVRESRPQVVQSQHFYMNLYAVCAARSTRALEVGAIRSDARTECKDVGALGPLSLQAPRVIAVNSRAAMANAVELGADAGRLHLLRNVVDTAHFVPAPPRGDRQVRLLAVGRNGPEKRFDRFLAALAAVRRRSNDPVIGVMATPSASDGPALRLQASALGLPPEALELHHGLRDIAPLYRSVDLFVLTSDWEGTPNVVLEAMASGLPVVATRVGGVPDVVLHGETGMICDVGNDAALEEAVNALTADRPLRQAMGRTGRDFVDTHHSVRALPGLLREFYGRVAA